MNGVAQQKYTMDDATFAEVIGLLVKQDAYTNADLAEIVNGLLTADDVNGLVNEAWAKVTYPDAIVTPVVERPLTVKVGESTGSANVANRGDITISQATGTMTVGSVVSDFGTVSLTAKDANTGDIVADTSYATNVRAANVRLDAAGSVGTDTDPLVIETGIVTKTAVGNLIDPSIDPATGKYVTPKVIWDAATKSYVTNATVDFTWIENYDETGASPLVASAGKDVSVAEKTGALGIGSVDAGGMVTLTAATIVDARDATATTPDISSAGVTLVTTEGDIGSSDKPITVDTNGSGTTAQDTVNASSPKNIYITEVAGDLRVGAITSGNDTILKVADGSLVDADPADRLTNLAALLKAAEKAEASAASAAEAAAIRTDTLARLLAEEQAAQKAADAAKTTADDAQKAADAAKIADDAAQKDLADATARQKALTDATGELAKAETDLKSAKDAQTALLATGTATAEQLKDAQDKVDAARKALDDKKQALEAVTKSIAATLGVDATAITPEALAGDVAAKQAAADATKKALDAANGTLAAAKDALSKATNALAAATKAYDDLKAETDALNQTATDQAALAKSLRASYDALAATPQMSSITTGGNLDATAKSIGAKGNALATNVAGVIGLHATDPSGTLDVVNLEQSGDLRVLPIVAKSITLTAEKNLSVENDGIGAGLEAPALSLNSVNGDVGAKDNPIRVRTDALSAFGRNVYVTGDDLHLDDVVATDTFQGDATGNITNTGDHVSVTAHNAILTAGGTIGEKSTPLVIDVDNLTATAHDVYLDSRAPVLYVKGITAVRDVAITATGNILGGIIKSENLTIDADGYVGLKDAPLVIDVTSTVSIRSNFRDVNYRQLWNEASDTNGEGEGVGAGGGHQLASTRSGLLPGTGDALGDSTPLSLVSLLIGMACVAAGFRRRRRKVSRRARSMA